MRILNETYSILPFLATLLPFVGAAFVPGVRAVSKRARDWLPFATILMAGILVLSMAPGVFGGTEYTYLGLHVTALGYLMGMVTTVVGLTVTAYSACYARKMSEPWLSYYHMLTLFFIGGILGMFFSTNLATIFLFLEASTIVSILLVSFERGRAFEAGYKFYMLSGLGAVFTIMSITLIYAATGTLELTDISRSLLGFAAKPVAMLNLAAVFTIVGLGLKAGLVPFHAWLPDAHSEAPTPISAILSGVVVKTGAYALFLILFSIYGVMSSGKIVLMLFFLAAVSMIFGAVMALVQTDVKRLLAYSTVSQMGYVLLGISYASAVGVEGGLFHILNHSVFKVSLFLCAGNLTFYTGTRNMRKMGGLARRMPLTAFSFTIAGLAMAGVPPFNGFWSKLLIYYAGLEQGQTVLTILAIFASAVTLAYVVRAMNLIFFAELPSEYSAVKERLDWMTLPSLCLAVLCIIIGVFPDFALQVIRPAAQTLLGLISRF